MGYKFQKGKMYRMPTHFGPSIGPRQGPDGQKFQCKDFPKTKSVSVSFLTNPKQLEAFLPENFSLLGEPVVTVTASYIKEIEWLAGRGYNTLGVSFPVEFKGKKDYATGNFLLVLWENLTDPIITGREELGFSKIYCKLPEPVSYGSSITCSASWMNFNFMNLNIKNLKPEKVINNPQKQNKLKSLKGTLHFKYIPKTGGNPGAWGESDISYAVITPEFMPNKEIKNFWKGEGVVDFKKANWEDMPTQFNIVNAFNNLDKKEYISASVTESVGAKDISDQRILY